MALVPPYGSAADNLERRLRSIPALDGTTGIPTAQEIINAVKAAGSPRRAARLRGWAVHALKRVGAPREDIIAMMVAAEAASRGKGV